MKRPDRSTRRTVLRLLPAEVGMLTYLLKKERDVIERYTRSETLPAEERKSLWDHIHKTTDLHRRVEEAFQRSLLPPKRRTVTIKVDQPLDDRALKRILGGR